MATKVPRREIRELSGKELNRLLLALSKMQNDSADMWRKITAIHGGTFAPEDVRSNAVTIPSLGPQGDYCHHRNETFPGSFLLILYLTGWHRAYLQEFEFVLQQNDPENKGHTASDRLMLPFWDWTGLHAQYGISVPDILVRSQVEVTESNNTRRVIRNPLYSARKFDGRRTSRGINSTADLNNMLQTGLGRPINITAEVREALDEDDHREFSNTRSSRRSVEDPHNIMHVAIGGDMQDPEIAAFDPIFWLHHCNVDRLFYAWQTFHQGPVSRPTNMNAELRPFPRKPKADNRPWQNVNGRYGYARLSDYWELSKLDYTYSYLPRRGGNSLKLQKTYVALEALHLPKMSTWIYVFIRRKKDPKFDENDLKMKMNKHPTCAGGSFIFTFRKQEGRDHCPNCETTQPWTHFIDVSDYVNKLNIRKPEEVEIYVIGKDIDNNIVDIKAAHHKLVKDSDFFEGPTVDTTQKELDPDLVKESARLAQFFKMYGYFKKGYKLADAVKDFQAAWGLKVDGIVGPKTREWMKKPRSANPDAGDVVITRLRDKLLTESSPVFKYCVTVIDTELEDPTKPDLGRDVVTAHVSKAFKAWIPALQKVNPKVEFKEVNDASDADIKIRWEPVDGASGAVAQVWEQNDFCYLSLDTAEYWTLEGNNGLRVYSVIVHEIGHLFGLSHSTKPESIMYPYYQEKMPMPAPEDLQSLLEHAKSHK